MRKKFVLLAILGVAWFQSLWAAASTHGIKLSWQESTPGTSFIIYRGPSGKEVAYATTGIGVTTYNDTNGVAGTKYCYVVAAVLDGIDSGDSPEVCAVFPKVPADPSGLSATPF
jgi:fibronectin type 3 domain-containing protein